MCARVVGYLVGTNGRVLQQATRAASSAAAAAVAPTRGTSPTRHAPVPADSHLSPIVRSICYAPVGIHTHLLTTLERARLNSQLLLYY